MTFDPFKKPDPQPWEEKRAEVKAHEKAQADERTLSLEQRVYLLERERVGDRLAIAAAQEVISKFITLAGQWVTREQLQVVRMQVNGLLIAAAFGMLFIIFGGR